MNQTPEEKAKELIFSYRFALSIPNAPLGEYKDSIAKQCALIAVDEIIDILEINGFTLQEYHDKGTLEYWIHVKDIITNK